MVIRSIRFKLIGCFLRYEVSYLNFRGDICRTMTRSFLQIFLLCHIKLHKHLLCDPITVVDPNPTGFECFGQIQITLLRWAWSGCSTLILWNIDWVNWLLSLWRGVTRVKYRADSDPALQFRGLNLIRVFITLFGYGSGQSQPGSAILDPVLHLI